MRKPKRTIKMLSALLIASATVVSSMPMTTVEAAAPVKLSKTKATLAVGGKTTIKVKKSSGVKIKKKTFTSKNKSVATVTNSGKVTAKSAGTAKITVKVKYKKKKKTSMKNLTFTVTVKGNTVTSKANNTNTGTQNGANAQNQQNKQNHQNEQAQKTEEKENLPNINVASSFKDMKVGEIGKKDNVYVGLSYVKRMSYLPTAFGEDDQDAKPKDGNEVILGFFDFYNHSDSPKSIDPSEITCYADGVQVKDVECSWRVECDGVKQFYINNVAGYGQMISVQDFEVPKGWKELKFFYESECVWTVSQSDVKEDNFKFSTMYTALKVPRTVTPKGTAIYNKDYQVIFDGTTNYTYNNVFSGEEKYVVFKFTVKNTGTSAIDFSSVGGSTRAYRNNYLMEESTYIMDDKIDGCINARGVEKIESGMSAQVYVAFEDNGQDGSLFLTYNDDYWSDQPKGTVFVE